MCPLCQRENRKCAIEELPNGRIVCACGLHSWPNSAVYAETCRRMNLTIEGQAHIWTQGM